MTFALKQQIDLEFGIRSHDTHTDHHEVCKCAVQQNKQCSHAHGFSQANSESTQQGTNFTRCWNLKSELYEAACFGGHLYATLEAVEPDWWAAVRQPSCAPTKLGRHHQERKKVAHPWWAEAPPTETSEFPFRCHLQREWDKT